MLHCSEIAAKNCKIKIPSGWPRGVSHRVYAQICCQIVKTTRAPHRSARIEIFLSLTTRLQTPPTTLHRRVSNGGPPIDNPRPRAFARGRGGSAFRTCFTMRHPSDRRRLESSHVDADGPLCRADRFTIQGTALAAQGQDVRQGCTRFRMRQAAPARAGVFFRAGSRAARETGTNGGVDADRGCVRGAATAKAEAIAAAIGK